MSEARQPQGCVKTGAVIKIEEYGVYIVTDLFRIGDCAYFRWVHKPYREAPRSVTHTAWIGHGICYNLQLERLSTTGHAVIPWSQITPAV